MYYLDLFPSGDFAEEIVYISFFLLFWNETHAIRNIYTYLAPHPCILILTSSRTLVNMNSAEDSPHITMQCITTFECSLAGVSVLQHSQSQRQRKGCKSWQFKLSSVSSASPNTGTYKWSRNNGAISPWLCIHVSNIMNMSLLKEEGFPHLAIWEPRKSMGMTLLVTWNLKLANLNHKGHFIKRNSSNHKQKVWFTIHGTLHISQQEDWNKWSWMNPDRKKERKTLTGRSWNTCIPTSKSNTKLHLALNMP